MALRNSGLSASRGGGGVLTKPSNPHPISRDSNPPVLAGNLPFLGVVPLFVLFEKESDLLYLFSEIE